MMALLLALLLAAPSAAVPPAPGSHHIAEWETRRLAGSGVLGVQQLASRLLGTAEAAGQLEFVLLPNARYCTYISSLHIHARSCPYFASIYRHFTPNNP
jgi:hypothetical protein